MRKFCTLYRSKWNGITILITSGSNIWLQVDPDDAMTHDLTTTLRSELAALEYKRDRLMSEVK